MAYFGITFLRFDDYVYHFRNKQAAAFASQIIQEGMVCYKGMGPSTNTVPIMSF